MHRPFLKGCWSLFSSLFLSLSPSRFRFSHAPFQLNRRHTGTPALSKRVHPIASFGTQLLATAEVDMEPMGIREDQFSRRSCFTVYSGKSVCRPEAGDLGSRHCPFGTYRSAETIMITCSQPPPPHMAPQPLVLHDTFHSNASAYTLATVHSYDEPLYSPTHSPTTPLLTPNSSSYGATFPRSAGVPSNSRKLIFNAALKMSTIFIVSTLLLGGTLWIALPTLEQ
jgi:hypothetical protein